MNTLFTKEQPSLSEKFSILARGREIEKDFFYLKSLEFGPLATEDEIKAHVEAALEQLRVSKI